MSMGTLPDERRQHLRTSIRPSDMGHLLEGTINGVIYRFKVLDVGQGGIGILVTEPQADVLRFMIKGACFTMDYTNPNGTLAVNVEIRHVTGIESGPFKGDYSVGFSISI